MSPEASPFPSPTQDVLSSPVDSTGTEEWLNITARIAFSDFDDSAPLRPRNAIQNAAPLMNGGFRRSASVLVTPTDLKHHVMQQLISNELLPVQHSASWNSRNETLFRRRLFSTPMVVSRRVTDRIRNAKHSAPVALGRAVARVRSPSLKTIVPKFLRKNRECFICQCPIEGTQVRVACGHYYDVACLLNRVEAATRDESLFPPSCCHQRILDRSFQRHMSPSLAIAYTEKSSEFGTIRRVYCANPLCSRFLGARSKGPSVDVFVCTSPSCTTRTCSRCRSAVHSIATHRCGHDRSQKQVLALANEKGWTRCPACDQMIELRSGCHQMTCVCTMQFCYLCSAPWKSCSCPRWEQVQLRSLDEPLSPRLVISAMEQPASPRCKPALRDTLSLPSSHDRKRTARPKIRRVPVPDVEDISQAHVSKLSTSQQDSLHTMDSFDHYIILRGLLAQRHRRAARFVASRPLRNNALTSLGEAP